MPESQDLEVYFDGQKTDYDLLEDEDNFYVYVEYQHSIHTIKIIFVVAVPFWMQWWFWLAILAVVIAIAGSFFIIRKRQR